MHDKNIVACVIARMKSKRLPKKSLADIAGFTMTEQLIRRLRTSKTITDIVICTSTNKEDQVLVDKSKEWGVNAYAGHEQDVLSRLIEVSEIYNADMILRVTGDNPFTDAVNIDRMVNHHIKTSADYTRTNGLPLGVTSEVMDIKMLKRLHEIMPDPNQSEYMSFYSFNPEVFHCEVLKALPEQNRPYYSLTIDYPEDIELARRLYSKISTDGDVPSIRDVIQELDDDEFYHGVDKNSLIKLPDGKQMRYEELITMLDELANIAKTKNI